MNAFSSSQNPPASRPFPAPLDPALTPFAWALGRAVSSQDSTGASASRKVQFAIERENGLVSRFDLPLQGTDLSADVQIAERCLKFLLWARGGWRVFVSAPPEVTEVLRSTYSRTGSRKFDVDVMEKIYEKEFSFHSCAAQDLPEQREVEQQLGGNLDGCRIGFDLGASDFKVAAVLDGEVIYSDEFPWNPKDQPDPSYHYEHINKGLKNAASHLPRVDAIGGSSAGVIVDNRFTVASLLRSISPEKLSEARNLFLRLREEWGVPLEVANDGDVTALAGAMSLGVSSLLGIAMGSSEAAGYINPSGNMTGWLNELAFAPVDLNPAAPPDEWSGDTGVGALYFSQQAVNKLLPSAGIDAPAGMDLPARLRMVQEMMKEEDPDAERIYDTVGVYLGHAIPLYARFYCIQHVLVLGRVTTGLGGSLILKKAREVLKHDYPFLAEEITLHLPDEKSRRVGQAVAAASLPKIR